MCLWMSGMVTVVIISQYTYIKSLHFIPTTNITLYVNYVPI